MSIRAMLALTAVAGALALSGVAYATAPAAGAGERVAAVTGAGSWDAQAVAHVAAPDQQAPSQKKHPKVDFSVPCQDCHARRTPVVVQQWQESRHAPNVGCFLCHGDGEVEFHARPSTQSCATCHSRKVEDMERAPVRDCFACHNSHRLKFHS